MSTALEIREEVIDAELVDDDYTRDQYEFDLSTVREFGEQLRQLNEQKSRIELAASIDMARRLHRMRTDEHQYWRKPGDKDTAEAFGRRVGPQVLLDGEYIRQLMSVYAGLVILEESQHKAGFPLPGTAGQIRRLSTTRMRRDYPEAIPLIWAAAVDDAGGGQPKQLDVERRVKEYIAQRQLEASRTLILAQGDNTTALKVEASLRGIRKRLAELYAQEPVLVRVFVADVYNQYRNV